MILKQPHESYAYIIAITSLSSPGAVVSVALHAEHDD